MVTSLERVMPSRNCLYNLGSTKWQVALLTVSVVLLLIFYFHSGGAARENTGKMSEVGERQQPPHVQEQEEKLISCASQDGAVSTAVKLSTGEVRHPVWHGQMFYRQSEPRDAAKKPLPAVVLLHGAAFSSQTWLDLGTLKYLGCHGYESFAFDLPGKGNSLELDGVDSNTLIHFLREKFHWSQFVIVSPSMSGRYSLPFITSGDTTGLIGFVPIAPAGISSFGSKLSSVHVRTLHIRGETDQTIGETAQSMLQKIPGASEYVMKGAGHACYMNNSREFHKVLLKFLEQLESRPEQ